VLGQLGSFLVDTVVTFFVVLAVARFLLQWLRVSFHNQVGEFVVLTTNWFVKPARKVIPAVAGLDAASIACAWLLQLAGLWLHAMIAGGDRALLALCAVALIELLRYAIYILVFSVIMQVVFSWVNPYAPLAPVFDSITRPFLRPIRKLIPPIGSIDLSPAVFFILLQLVLIAVNYLSFAAAGIG